MCKAELLSFKKEQREGKWHYYLKGRLDTSTTPLLEKEFLATIQETDHLILDCEKLEYVSSSGLRLLLNIHKKLMQGGGLCIRYVNQEIMEVLEMTGFLNFLAVEEPEI